MGKHHILILRAQEGYSIETDDLPPCPVCGAKPFISRDCPDGFYIGWSVGCPRYSINDGIHGIVSDEEHERHSYTMFGLDNREECEEWWRKRVERFLLEQESEKGE